MLEIRPVTGIGEVRPGADLAALIMAAAPWVVDDDVLVVTSKIVSKAEGRLAEVPPEDGPARDAVRAAVLAGETVRVVARRGPTRIVQTRHGLVLAAAGIDASNVDRDRLVLLPVDPDRSARALRAALRDRYGRRVGVVVTDTMGRPWRLGLTDVAIGAAGVPPVRDYRGEVDPYGNELQVTQMALIDELAAAGELVKGKYDGVPVAVVRGLRVGDDDGPGARHLVRPADEDMFALGTAEARAAGLADAAAIGDAPRFADGPVDPELVAAAFRHASAGGTDAPAAAGAASAGGPVRPADSPFVHVTASGVRDKLRDLAPPGTAEVVVAYLPAGAGTFDAALAGAAVHRLRAALAASGLATAWIDARDALTGLVTRPAGHAPLGLLAVGWPA